MSTTTTPIYHDRDRFMQALTIALAEPEQLGVMTTVDVVASDARPGELLLVVFEDVGRKWYSDDRRYNRYQDAFMALGRYLDELNPEHKTLTDNWQ